MSLTTVKITARSDNPTKTLVRVRDFEIIIDEPQDLGGTNQGPNPVEYELAALAGCLNVVGHVVAAEMGLPMKNLSFKLQGSLDVAKFKGEATDQRAGFQKIEVEVNADCQATAAQLEAWLKEVSGRCPVSDNLSNRTPVQIGFA